MSREIANAVRSELPQPAPGLNRLLERHLANARSRSGELDVAALLSAVSAHYDRIEAERRGVVRSMQKRADALAAGPAGAAEAEAESER